MQRINIAIADDHQILIDALALTLSKNEGFSVMLKALNGKDLIDKIIQSNPKPDVCIVDIRMPVLNGIDATKEIRKMWPSIKVLILSSHDHEHTIINALRSGANGYLLKETDIEELENAIKAVHIKGAFHNELVPDFHYKATTIPELTTTERQLMLYCCEELTYKQIGELMNLSLRTIDNYTEKLFKKLNVKNRTGLVMFAVRTGFI
jgi:DNA-binding NarL/FixJ family response regulator